MARRKGQAERTTPASAVGDGEADATALDITFDITVVDGEQGRRLAVLQAGVILDVLMWLHRHGSAAPNDE